VAAVPADISTEQAALLPLAAIAARAARMVGGRAGDRATVIGSGVLAELVRDALCAAGLTDVTIAATPGDEIPRVVIDTTGDPAVISELLVRAPRLGHLALVGAGRGRTADVDFYRTIHQRGLEVVGVHEHGPLSPIVTTEDRARDLATAAALVGSARRHHA
jgi:threonine dehydrogenase-like Zn-dependent dehydrogenase